jgi:osmotically inducible protein OsmC
MTGQAESNAARPDDINGTASTGEYRMASIKRRASAAWFGSGKDGKGSLTTQSATLKDTPYSFTARFGDGKGTNPEELIAVAHAGCFGMATAFQLSGAGHPPESLNVDATLTMEQDAGGWKIASVHLELRGRVPGIDAAKFQELAADAKANCPVSKVLNAAITLDAKLES